MTPSLRTLAISDVHGCLQALECLIETAAIQPGETMVFLGDYIDRGPDSKAVIDWILRRQSRYQIIALRGNHESIMMDARGDEFSFERWVYVGGKETLASYGASWDADWHQAIPSSHWQFIRQTPLYHETATHIFVHGYLAPDLPPAKQTEDLLLWERCHDLQPHESGRQVVCGHTPQISGRPLRLPGGLCIDTGAVYGGWLTCLEAESGRYWQANQDGDVRQGIIRDLPVCQFE